MRKDNSTPMLAKDYDTGINKTVPFYNEFYNQTLDVITQCGFSNIEWLDLGCGTGTLEQIALQRLQSVKFVALDPSEQMLEQARIKLEGNPIEYICSSSTSINFDNRFDVVTAIQSNHYLQKSERKVVTEKVFNSLKQGGIYISFENVVPEDDDIKKSELLRWGNYQQRNGKTIEEARLHNARCGVEYFPLTVSEHIKLLKDTGFQKCHVFWLSYMQMGIYGIK